MNNWNALKRSHESLKLSLVQKFFYYAIVLLLLVTPVTTGIELVQREFNSNREQFRTSSELIDTSIPFLIIAVTAFLVKRNGLRYYEINIEYTDEEFKEAVRRTREELKWTIRHNNKRVLQAISDNSPLFSWGELITIQRFKNRLLLNSIGDPDERPSMFSFGINRKNIRVFLKNLEDTINKVPYLEKPPVVVKEWSLKNTVGRILLYILSLFILSAGLIVIYFSNGLQAIILGLITCFVGGLYIYLDVKVLMRKQGNMRFDTLREANDED